MQEYSTEVNNNHNDMTILKLNLKMIENTWIGGGVIFDDERTYFLKISNIAIYGIRAHSILREIYGFPDRRTVSVYSHRSP